MQFRENDSDAVEHLCEAVHTAFRKGCEGGSDVWHAIHQMPAGEFRSAMAFAVYGLRVSGVRVVFETDQAQPTSEAIDHDNGRGINT